MAAWRLAQVHGWRHWMNGKSNNSGKCSLSLMMIHAAAAQSIKGSICQYGVHCLAHPPIQTQRIPLSKSPYRPPSLSKYYFITRFSDLFQKWYLSVPLVYFMHGCPYWTNQWGGSMSGKWATFLYRWSWHSWTVQVLCMKSVTWNTSFDLKLSQNVESTIMIHLSNPLNSVKTVGTGLFHPASLYKSMMLFILAVCFQLATDVQTLTQAAHGAVI